MDTSQLQVVQDIQKTVKRIEKLLEDKSGTTNTTRIGALNRISEAIGYINEVQKEMGSSSTSPIQKIKDILLGR